MKRKLFAILMALTLVLTYMPALAFAEEDDYSAGTIIAGEEMDVEITESGDSVTYTFVPEFSGWYAFSSSGEYNTCATVFDADGEEIAYNDDDGDGNNFMLKFYAEENETYYLRSQMLSDGTGSFTVSLIESQSWDLRRAISDLGDIFFFNEDNPAELNVWVSTEENFEQENPVFNYAWYKDDSEEVISNGTLELDDGGNYATAFFADSEGIYTCEVTLGDDPDTAQSVSFDVQEEGSSSDDGERFSGNAIEDTIAYGETKNVEIEESWDYASFEFEAEDDGWYCFSSNSDTDTYGRVLDADGEVIASDDDGGEGSNFSVNFEANAGETFYLQSCFYASGTGSFTVSLTEGTEQDDPDEPDWYVECENDDIDVEEGQTAVFKLNVFGDVPDVLTYSWEKYNEETQGWSVISGANKDSYTVVANGAAEGKYRCTATDSVGNSDWDIFYLSVYNESNSWYADTNENRPVLVDGKATLEVYIEADDYVGSYSYLWGKYDEETDKYEPISGVNANKYVATSTGDYRCFVKDTKTGKYDTVFFEVRTWIVRAVNDEMDLLKDGEVTLELEFLGAKPDYLSYKWYKWDNDIDEYIEITGENADKLTVTEGGSYDCRVYYNEDDYVDVRFDVYELSKTWKAEAEQEDVELKIGKKAKLKVLVSGTHNDLTYKWCNIPSEYDYDYEETSIDEIIANSKVLKEGADDFYEVAESGRYLCGIYEEGNDEPEGVFFYVFDEVIRENGVCYRLYDNYAYAESDDDSSTPSSIVIKDTVKFSDGKSYPVKEIGSFWGCRGLKSVTLPSGAEMIGGNAFINTGLTSVKIPSSVTFIGDHAFGFNGNYDEEKEDYVYTPVTGFIIYGKTGSEAEKYAKVNGFKFSDPDAEAAAEKAKADAEAKAKADAAAEAKAKAEAEAEAKAKASNINKATVSAADIKKASNLGLTSITLGAKVKKIKKNAFKGTKIKTVTVKSKKLTKKSVKGSLKGSKVKTIKVKVGNKKANKKFVKKYKKIFTKKNAGKKVAVK